ncbi:hypothetical protein MZM67_002438 [Enterococcus faecium]|nr:hypothetical protein [Enterococcus faecium]
MKKINIWMDEDVHADLKRQSREEGVIIGEMIAKLLRFYRGNDSLQARIDHLESYQRQLLSIARSTEDNVEVIVKMMNSEYLVTESVSGYFKEESTVYKEAKEAMIAEKDKQILQRYRESVDKRNT